MARACKLQVLGELSGGCPEALAERKPNNVRRPRRGEVAKQPNNEHAWRVTPQLTEQVSIKISFRRVVRAVEGARLESVYTATYRGFESLTLRQ